MRQQAKFIALLIFILMFTACGQNQNIRIGFVGTLSGPNSIVGISMRDGILLKVDEVNAAGGINGQQIELLIQDDLNDADKIKSINETFIQDGIDIIFGHELSSKAKPLFEVIKDKELIVMSPTLSTYELSGIDDNFFRTIPSNYDQGTELGNLANLESKKTLFIYTNANKKFADGVNEGYADSFSGSTEEYPVKTNIVDEAEAIVDIYKSGNFDSVMYVMNPDDVMYMSQMFFKHQIDTEIYSSNWGMAVNMLDKGGRAIEGATFVSFMGNLDGPRYLSFRDAYYEKYQKEPEFAAVYAYEAASFLFEALKESDSLGYLDIKSSLLNLGEQEGLVSPLKLDEFGDIKRKLFLAVVEDGKLVILE